MPQNDLHIPKLLVIATGGTIASVDDGEGLTPRLDAKDLLSRVPSLSELCRIDTIQPFSVDSCNMTPARWCITAKLIREKYNDYDGFIITHGTDTMAYGAAMLSCLIRHSRKPTVLTGSQFPIDFGGSDASDNLKDAVSWACECIKRGCTVGYNSVYVVFAGRVINGMRARKRHTIALDAFESVNYSDIAKISQGNITYSPELVYYEETRDADFIDLTLTDESPAPLMIHLTPGMTSERLLAMCDDAPAVIFEGFGIGGIPDALLPAIAKIKAQGTAIILKTQVPYEKCDFAVYRVGRMISAGTALSKNQGAGIVAEAGDLTAEAAFALATVALNAPDIGWNLFFEIRDR